MASCVRGFDVNFANPCADDLHIKTYVEPVTAETGEGKPPEGEFVAKGLTVTHVENAFNDAGADVWTIYIEESADYISVVHDDLTNSTVVIPATACP